MHERDLIKVVRPTFDIIGYNCNYGHVYHPWYTPPPPKKKKKSLAKTRKPRKQQGDGSSFNSQITFLVRSLHNPPIDYESEHIPSDTHVYKFKVFRTGKIQLPGVRQDNIDDVLECSNFVVDMLNECLHRPSNDQETIVDNICSADTTLQPPSALTSGPSALTSGPSTLIYLRPVMKNYKFIIKLPANHIIDLPALKRIVDCDRVGACPCDSARTCVCEYRYPNMPLVYITKYSRRESKMSITFTTPVTHKLKKKTRLNVFMRGRSNLLGAFYQTDTTIICDYLHHLFELYTDVLIVPEGGCEPLPKWRIPYDNVEDGPIIESIPTRHIPDDIAQDVLNDVCAQYDDIMRNGWDALMSLM
jgi:hypothetical protein